MVTLLLAACGSSDDDSTVETDTSISRESTELPAPDVGAPTDGSQHLGPRRLGGTIIDLDLEAFPQPAANGCADATAVVDVGPGASIASAIESAAPGTTIELAPGEYVEQPDEWVALRIDTDNVCLRASDGPATVAAADGQTAGIIVTGDDVVLAGLELRGFEVGVLVDGRPGETQRRLTIEDTKITDLTGEFREGIVVVAEPQGDETVLDGLLISGVSIEGTDLGVSCNIGPCEHVWLEDSTITGRPGSEDSGADGFAIEEGRQIVLVDTTVTGVAADGIDTKASDVVVDSCRVIEVGRNGIKLWRGGDVINTIVDGTGADASLVGEEPGTYRYLHTLIAHHGEPGDTPYVATWSYDARSSDLTIEIVNSIFYENAPGGMWVPEGTRLSIRNSIFEGATDDRLVAFGDGPSYDFGDLTALEDAGFGAGNVVADPGLVADATHNYATGPTSPARDRAEPIIGIERDAAGGPRVRGPGPDIGPIES
jgi:hypothetical protein